MEEDIKILEELKQEYSKGLDRLNDKDLSSCMAEIYKYRKKQVQAINNVLSELEKYKKIAEKLAEVVDFERMDFNCSPLCIHDNCIEECALEWARKEVEKED